MRASQVKPTPIFQDQSESIPDFDRFLEQAKTDTARQSQRISNLKDDLEKFDTSFLKSHRPASQYESEIASQVAGRSTPNLESVIPDASRIPHSEMGLFEPSNKLSQNLQRPSVMRSKMVPQKQNYGGIDAPEDFQMKLAIEEDIKEKSEIIYRLKDAIHKLQLDIQDKDQKYQELKQLFGSKHGETKETEKAIKKEFHDTKEKVESLNLYKKRENYNFKNEREKIIQKQKKAEAILKKLQDELKEVEDKLIEIQKEAEGNHQKSLNKFKQAIRPLEDAVYQVEDQKVKVEDKLGEIQKEIDQNVLRLQMYEEDLRSKLIQKHEKVQRKQELYAEFENMKEKYPQELQQFYDDLENEKQIKELKHLKGTLQTKLQTCDTFRKSNRDKIASVHSTIQRLKKEIDQAAKNKEGAYSKNLQETQKIETFFAKCYLAYNSIALPSVTQKVTDAAGFILDFEVLARQLQIMERYHIQMRTDLTKDKEELELKLQTTKSEILSLKQLISEQQQIPRERKSVSQIEQEKKIAGQFKLKCQLFKKSADEIKQIKVLERTKLRAIQQWIDQQRLHLAREGHTCVPLNELQRVDLDRDILEETLRHTLHKIDDASEKRNYEDMLTLYLEKVSEREVELQHYISRQADLRRELEENEDQLKQLEEKVKNQDIEWHELKKNITTTASKEKAYEQLVDERRDSTEFEIYKQAEENFNSYLSQHKDIFTEVKKTYGTKISEKMKGDQKKEFIEMISSQMRQRRKLNEENHLEILEIDEYIERAQVTINEVLPVKMDEKHQLLSDLAYKRKVLTQQVSLIFDSEQQLASKIEVSLQKKKEEIIQQSQTIYRQRNYDNHERRAHELRVTIQQKEVIIEKCVKEVKDSEKMQFERNTQYEAQEVHLRTRLDNLNAGDKELNKNIKPQLVNLERDIKDLVHQITHGKKKSDALIEKLEQAQNQLNNSKKGYFEKFGVNIDENELFMNADPTANQQEQSPSNQIDVEYTEDYQRLRALVQAEEQQRLRQLEEEALRRQMEEDAEMQRRLDEEDARRAAMEIQSEPEEPNSDAKFGQVNIDIFSYQKQLEDEEAELRRKQQLANIQVLTKQVPIVNLEVQLLGANKLESEFFEIVSLLKNLIIHYPVSDQTLIGRPKFLQKILKQLLPSGLNCL